MITPQLDVLMHRSIEATEKQIRLLERCIATHRAQRNWREVDRLEAEATALIRGLVRRREALATVKAWNI